MLYQEFQHKLEVKIEAGSGSYENKKYLSSENLSDDGYSKPHQCNDCGKEITSSRRLLQHRQEVHSIEMFTDSCHDVHVQKKEIIINSANENTIEPSKSKRKQSIPTKNSALPGEHRTIPHPG